jgi:hypothetical protein
MDDEQEEAKLLATAVTIHRKARTDDSDENFDRHIDGAAVRKCIPIRDFLRRVKPARVGVRAIQNQ